MRAEEGQIHLPIILLAPAVTEVERRAAFLGVADDYSIKPISPADLLDRGLGSKLCW